MNIGVLNRVFACLLCIVVPSAGMSAEANAAILYAGSGTTLNGTNVVRGSAIFPGDKIQVPVNSGATINTKGSIVTVAPGSSLTFQGDTVALDVTSAVSVSTTSGLQVRTARLVLGAQGKTGKFTVARFTGNVVVEAKEGPVLVSDGQQASTVAEGKTQVFQDDDDKEKKDKKRFVPCVDPRTGSIFKGCFPEIVGLAAAGAAAVTAIETTKAGTTLLATPTHP